MIQLQDICGLSLSLDEETGDLHYENSVNCADWRSVPISEIIPILLNKSLKYPEFVYTHYAGFFDTEDDYRDGVEDTPLTYDVFKLPNGLLGIEYAKTHVYYSNESNGKYACFVEVMKGELTLIVQRNEHLDDPYVSTPVRDVKILHLVAGDRFAIPTGVMYTFINTGSETVIFTVIANTIQVIDYSMLSKEKGLAYFIISKNARLEIVANPKYKIYEPARRRSWRAMKQEDKAPYFHETLRTKNPFYKILQSFKKDFATLLV
jgi:oxalate decarboxylase/phosphoglucose isomerase-like protein (cupin superfamily)